MKINFVILKNGSDKGFSKFLCEDDKGKLIATITPHLEQSGKYSARFMNVCFMDGSCELADREQGENETSHANELIEKYLLKKV